MGAGSPDVPGWNEDVSYQGLPEMETSGYALS